MMDQSVIDKMDAGWELDALVAKEVLHLPTIHGGHWVRMDNDTLMIGLDWKPSADIADAWPVLKRMKERGYEVVHVSTDSWGDSWQCHMADAWRHTVSESDMDFFADADTPELAICRCALKAAAYLDDKNQQ